MQQVDYSLLGTRIRLKRKEMGITQAEMAERCGVSVPFIGHIERGSRAPQRGEFLGDLPRTPCHAGFPFAGLH